MQQTLVARFPRDDPETPPTMDEQIEFARTTAQKLGIPNYEIKRHTARGRNAHTGQVLAYVEWTWEGLRYTCDLGRCNAFGASSKVEWFLGFRVAPDGPRLTWSD